MVTSHTQLAVSRLAGLSSLPISDVIQCENFVPNVSLLRRMSDLEIGGGHTTGITRPGTLFPDPEKNIKNVH